MFRTLILKFLCGLFVLVSSVSLVLFFFSVLEPSQFFCHVSFFATVQPNLVIAFLTSSSASSWFSVLSLLLSNPGSLYSSSSWFFLWSLWGLFSVNGRASAPAVLVVTPPLFHLLRLLCPLLLCVVCSVSSYPLHFSASRIPSCSFQSFSVFFHGLILRLLLHVFLLVFFGLLRLRLLFPFSLCISTGCGCGCS